MSDDLKELNLSDGIFSVRNVMGWGRNKAVRFPNFWLRPIEASMGEPLEYVLVKVKGEKIEIEPLKKEQALKLKEVLEPKKKNKT